jgi:hypothetical protein
MSYNTACDGCHLLNLNLQEYIDHIQEIVSWMGWTPCKITYASFRYNMSYNTIYYYYYNICRLPPFEFKPAGIHRPHPGDRVLDGVDTLEDHLRQSQI